MKKPFARVLALLLLASLTMAAGPTTNSGGASVDSWWNDVLKLYQAPMIDPTTGYPGVIIEGSSSTPTNPTVVTGVPAASTSIASTVTTAGTFQSATPANTARKGCFIQNTSSYIEYIYLGATVSATLTNATQIQPGGTFTCAAPFGVVADDNVAITVATGGSGATYVGWIQ